MFTAERHLDRASIHHRDDYLGDNQGGSQDNYKGKDEAGNAHGRNAALLLIWHGDKVAGQTLAALRLLGSFLLLRLVKHEAAVKNVVIPPPWLGNGLGLPHRVGLCTAEGATLIGGAEILAAEITTDQLTTGTVSFYWGHVSGSS